MKHINMHNNLASNSVHILYNSHGSLVRERDGQLSPNSWVVIQEMWTHNVERVNFTGFVRALYTVMKSSREGSRKKCT